jgi:hypothetical protein
MTAARYGVVDVLELGANYQVHRITAPGIIASMAYHFGCIAITDGDPSIMQVERDPMRSVRRGRAMKRPSEAGIFPLLF